MKWKDLVPWLALLVAAAGFFRSSTLDDISVRERIAKLEVNVDYLKNATNRLLDALQVPHPEDPTKRP